MAYVQKLSRDAYPGFPAGMETAATVYARFCVGCHVIDGEGGTDGPDLSHIGREHVRAYLRRLIADPESVNPDADMPGFRTRLSDQDLDAMATYLASRK